MTSNIQSRALRKRVPHVVSCAIAGAISILLSACDSGGPETAPSPIVEYFEQDYSSGITPSATPQNVLFIILDAFHGEHSSLLGYERETTPNLEALAEDGVYFTAAHSQSANTVGSTLSFLTGQYLGAPSDAMASYFVSETSYTMANAFADSGFETGGFSANPWIVPRLRFDKGFGHFVDSIPIDKKDKINRYRRRKPGAESKLIEDAKHWIESKADSNWFCYLHLMRPHTPYETPESYQNRFVMDEEMDHSWRAVNRIIQRARPDRTTEAELQVLRDTYDSNIAYADHLVGELLDWLESVDEYSDTLIIVASDHGEAFMQHDLVGHNKTVYEEMTQVPLIIRAPSSLGLVTGGVDIPVEMVDLFPTLADIFGLRVREPLHGRSLLGLLTGSDTAHKNVLFSQTNRADLMSVREGDMKMILERKAVSLFVPRELYDLSVDPGELNNLLEDESLLGNHLALSREYIRRFYVGGVSASSANAPGESAPQLSEDEVDTLKSLGYFE